VNDVNRRSKGLFLMLAGIILFFYALGILKKELIIIFIAIYLLALGFVQLGGVEKAKALLKRNK